MRNLAVYIHYPFCKSKCPYCDFNSHVREKVDSDIWLESYLKELKFFFDKTGKRPVSSIFFGGGTPSLMPPKTVEALIEFIDKNWGLDDNAEITLEANPTSVEYEKFKSFRAAGVNRVSIGVQSFDEAELKFLGREHSSDEAKTAIQYAAETFPRFSFDLIYALPEQSLQQWERELQSAITLAGSHLSLYQLTIEQNTNFYNQYKKGAFIMPENELAAEFYELTQNICESHGLPAYETSNHASPGEESRHNLSYWKYDEYLGIGPGAHGRLQNHASVMTRSPEKWLDKVQTQNNGLEDWLELSERESFEEKIMMGMRLKQGMTLDDFSGLNNVDALKKAGFIEVEGNNIRPSKSGMLMVNAIVEKLLA